MDNRYYLAKWIVVLFTIAFIIAFAMWTDRTLDFWCTYFSAHKVNVPILLSALVAIFGNGAMFLLNTVSEIIRLFM